MYSTGPNHDSLLCNMEPNISLCQPRLISWQWWAVGGAKPDIVQLYAASGQVMLLLSFHPSTVLQGILLCISPHQTNILKQCRFATLILRATAASVERGGVRGRELYNSIILMPQAQFNPWSQSWWTFSQARFIQLYLQKCRRLEKQLPHQIKHIGLLWICLPGRADRSIHPSIIQSFRSYKRSLVESWAPEDNLYARCSLAPPQS